MRIGLKIELFRYAKVGVLRQLKAKRGLTVRRIQKV